MKITEMELMSKYPNFVDREEYVIQGGRGDYNHDMLPEVAPFDQFEVKHITYSGRTYSITEQWVTVRASPPLTYETLQCCPTDTPMFTCCTEPEHRGQSQEKGG